MTTDVDECGWVGCDEPGRVVVRSGPPDTHPHRVRGLPEVGRYCLGHSVIAADRHRRAHPQRTVWYDAANAGGHAVLAVAPDLASETPEYRHDDPACTADGEGMT
jgi:hypothetical protein